MAHCHIKLVALFLLSLALTGCGGSSSTSEDPNTVGTPNIENNEQDAGSTTTSDSDAEKIKKAMATGDASLLPDSVTPLENQLLNSISQQRQATDELFNHVYGEETIQYTPGIHSQFFMFQQLGGAYPLIQGNSGSTLAAATEYNNQRNAAFGTNIIRSLQEGSYAQYEPQFKRLLSWLLKRDNVSAADPATIKLSLMDSTTAQRTTQWLTQHYPQWEVTSCLDTATLATCISRADLIITGSNPNNPMSSSLISTVTSTLKKAQSNGAALLYIHLHSWNSSALSNPVANIMNLSMQGPGGPGNYFSNDAANWDNYPQMLADHSPIDSISQLVTGLTSSNGFSFDIASCTGNCSEFESEFSKAANQLKRYIARQDSQNINIFAEQGFEFEKQLILLADVYRQTIRYPMGPSTDTSTFMKAYFSDYLVYNSRNVNPAQADLGSFGRSDFSHVTPSTKTLQLLSKRHFRSAGVYAIPGQPFTVTRHDNSDLNVSVFINTQRAGSTHEFNKNGYSRPKFLQSTKVAIKPGQTITLTSPYGGPIQLGYNKNDQNVALTFTNIGEHAYWASSADNDSFTAKLEAGDFDWAEIATASFEVHSQLNKMRNSIGGTWATAADLAQATETYTHNYPHVLAGFQGPGIDVVPEIHDFANNNGWEVPVLDLVKHMNADQATCGAGCSGNPYDAYWAFGPTSHGDIHELGHGLEKGKFRFAGWDGHASTNPYSYYSKSKYAAATNTSSSCQSLPSAAMFETLQESLRESDPFAYMQAANLTSWSQGAALYIQMMMAAQEQGALIDGWHLLARLHLLLNEYNKADNNDTEWSARRNTLGFNGMDRATATALNNNDWLAISISYVTGYNYSDFLTMWGLAISDDTKAFILSQGYPAMPLKFYQTSGNDYCEGLDKPAILITDRDGDGYIDAFDAFPDNPAEHADADGDGLGDNADTQYDLNPAEMDYHNVEIQRANNAALCMGVDNTAPLLNKQIKEVSCNQDGTSLWSWGQDGRIHSKSEPSLCIQSSGHNNDASLTLQTCSDSDMQKWSYTLSEKSIRNRINTRAAFDLFSNGNVKIWGAHGGVNQQWVIVTP